MKLIAVSIKKLGPFKWLRKIRGFKLVYTPLIAIILFTAVMGIILGTLQLQERSQQESALFRELSFAKQRIQLRFANNTETLISIARESAKNDESEKLKKETFVQVESFLNSNHEIIQVIWLNENKVRQWSLPHSSGKNELLNQLGSAPTITQELNKAVDLSKATNRPAYSQFIFLKIQPL